MTKLDITKPLMFRNNTEIADVKYLVEYKFFSEIKNLAFLVSEKNGSQFIAIRRADGRSASNIADDDIINVPEKPAFFWDKPYRVKDDAYKILAYVYDENDKFRQPHGLALSRHGGTPMIHWYTNNGKYCLNSDSDRDLENYEPEDTYALIDGDHAWEVHKSNRVFGFNDLIARFDSRKDAEAFLKFKERGF